MIIDTHCHYDMMPNPEVYIKNVERKGDIAIGMTNLPSHFQMGYPFIKLLHNVRLSLGFHPLLISDNQNELKLFGKMLDKTSYIGEIGLDFSKEAYSTRDIQIDVLSQLLIMLKGKNKILSVHSRRAEKTLLELLKKYEIKNVIFHWYSGPVNIIKEIVDQGYYFSINEAMTLSENGRKIIAAIPRERILTETDAPYNSYCSIRNVLEYVHLSERDIHENFMKLINRLKYLK